HGTAAPPSDVPVQDSLRTMSQASVAFRTALNNARLPADAEHVHALLVRLTTSAQTLSDRAAAIIDAYSLNKSQQELDKALANNADAKAQFDHDTLTDDDLSRVAAYMSDQQCKD